MSKLYDLLSTMCSKIKKPDWNQNDPTAPDYVKNRPFWTGDPVETVIISERTEFLSPNATYGESNADILDGDRVFVVWNGVEYERIAQYDVNVGAAYVGNLGLLGEKDTGEPFFIAAMQGVSILAAYEPGMYTFSVSSLYTEVHPIEKKYLPWITEEIPPKYYSTAGYTYNIAGIIPLSFNSPVNTSESCTMSAAEYSELVGQLHSTDFILFGSSIKTGAGSKNGVNYFTTVMFSGEAIILRTFSYLYDEASENLTVTCTNIVEKNLTNIS